MPAESIIWGVSTLFHVILLLLLIWHDLRRFTQLIWWQVFQVPFIYSFHHHDLTNSHFWMHYKLVFVIGRLGDIILAIRAVNETLHTDIHAIAIMLEAWLGAQLALLVTASYYPELWARGELGVNIIYLIFQVLWIRLLAGDPHD
jgi:hypothetical protein